jgi:uncharacterized membrane-anchored protein YhcB (DUF1043 family)
MTPIVGVSIVVGLAVVFLFVRRTARKMRERRARQRRRLKRSMHRRHHEKTTQRSEMRAYEDQTTVMGDITTTDRQKLRS